MVDIVMGRNELQEQLPGLADGPRKLAFRAQLRDLDWEEDKPRCVPLGQWPMPPTTVSLLDGLYTLRISNRCLVELRVARAGAWRAADETPVEATVEAGSRTLRLLRSGELCRQAGKAALVKEASDEGDVLYLRSRVHPEGWVSIAQWFPREEGEPEFNSTFWEPLSSDTTESGWGPIVQEARDRQLDLLRSCADDACAAFQASQAAVRKLASSSARASSQEGGAGTAAALLHSREVADRNEARGGAIGKLREYVRAAEEALVLPPEDQRRSSTAACDREWQAREAVDRLRFLEYGAGFDAGRELERLSAVRDAAKQARADAVRAESDMHEAEILEKGEDEVVELERAWRGRRSAAQSKDKAFQKAISQFSRLCEHLPEILPDLLTKASAYVKKELLALKPLDQSRVLDIFAMERSLVHYDDELNRMEKLSKPGARHAVHATSYSGAPCVLKVFDMKDRTNVAGFLKEVVLHRKLQHPLVVPLRQAFLDANISRGAIGILHFDRYPCDLDVWGRTLARKEADPDGAVRLLAFKMVQSVCHIHALGVVHGDLKPSNWLFDAESKTPLLCDFETANDRGVGGVTATRVQTTACQDLQTWGYVAPERERDPLKPKSRASDMFSLGMSISFLTKNAGVRDERLEAVAKAMTMDDPSQRVSAQEAQSMPALSEGAALPALAFDACPPYWANRSEERDCYYQWHRSAFMEQEVRRLLQDSTCELCASYGVATGVRSVKVNRVENSILWKSYASRRLELAETVKRYGPFSPVNRRHLQVEQARLDEAINEVFLWHGLSGDIVSTVANSGLDDRVAHTGGLYGAGIYLTDQWCKAVQYSRTGKCSIREKVCGRHPRSKYRCFCSGPKRVLLCRALLGEAYHAKPNDKLKGLRRPPYKEGAAPGRVYDSVMAWPGFSNRREQGHHEYVFFDRKSIYVEWVVEINFD